MLSSDDRNILYIFFINNSHILIIIKYGCIYRHLTKSVWLSLKKIIRIKYVTERRRDSLSCDRQIPWDNSKLRRLLQYLQFLHLTSVSLFSILEERPAGSVIRLLSVNPEFTALKHTYTHTPFLDSIYSNPFGTEITHKLRNGSVLFLSRAHCGFFWLSGRKVRVLTHGSGGKTAGF